MKRSVSNSERSLELQEEVCVKHKDLGVMNEPITKLGFHGTHFGKS